MHLIAMVETSNQHNLVVVIHDSTKRVRVPRNEGHYIATLSPNPIITNSTTLSGMNENVHENEPSKVLE